MIGKKFLKINLIIFIVLSIITVNTASAYSSFRHNHHRGRFVTIPELLAALIVFGGIEYYYHHGYFYRKVPSGYLRKGIL